MSCCNCEDETETETETGTGTEQKQLQPMSTKEIKNLDNFEKFSKGFDHSVKQRSYPSVKTYAAQPQQYSSTFMEFLPENEENQKLYSAMSPSWVGEKKTSEAIQKGAY